MTDEIEVPCKIDTAKDDEDLSQQIVRAVEKKAQEQVTCRRVNHHHYRCNWWTAQDTNSYDNPAMKGLLVTTSRICHSQFLHARKVGDRLQIRVISGNKPRA